MTSLYQTMTENMELRGLASSTCKSSLRCVRRYARFYDASPDELDRTHLRGFLLYLHRPGRAPATLKVHRAALLSLYVDTLGREAVMDGIPAPRVPRRAPMPALSRQQVQALLDAADPSFDRPFLSLLYGTGLRLSEARNLQVADLDPSAGLLYVRHGKGDKARAVHLSHTVTEMLRDHWRLARPGHTWLSPAQRLLSPGVVHPEHRWADRPVSSSTMTARFARIRQRAALKRHVTMHDLRRAYATHLLEDGVDSVVIQRLLGHACPSTTARHTAVHGAMLRQTPCPLKALGDPEPR